MVGMTGSSSAHGLRIFETDDEAKQTPFVTVAGAVADASALDLAQENPRTTSP